MSLLYSGELLRYPKGTRFLVDTCVLIDASKSQDIKELLEKMGRAGYEMRTIAPAWVEFLRPAKTLEDRAELRKFLTSLGIGCIDDRQKELFSSDGALFQLILRQCKVNNPSYVDLLLLFVVSIGENIRLVTSNYRDVPLEFFDIEQTIVQCSDKGMQKATYIYTFNYDNFNRMAANIKRK